LSHLRLLYLLLFESIFMSDATTEPDLIDRAEITGGTVLVEYNRTEAALADLRARYAGAVYDLTTTAGDKAARAARLEIVTLRTGLEKRRKELKEPAVAFGKRIDEEAKRITAEILALETPIDEQIKSDEARRAAEKAEKERIAAERVAGFRERIAAITACVARCHGIDSARIERGIAAVEAIEINAGDWAEFFAEAEIARSSTINKMHEILIVRREEEAVAARVEAQRVENERIAEEQRAAAKIIADQQEAARAAAEALAERVRAVERAEAELAARQAEVAARQRAEEEAKAQPEPMPMPAPPDAAQVAQPAGTVTQLVLKPTGARIKLGQINERLNARGVPVTITAAGLAQLGFEPVDSESNAKLYLEADFQRICTALIDRLTVAAELRAA